MKSTFWPMFVLWTLFSSFEDLNYEMKNEIEFHKRSRYFIYGTNLPRRLEHQIAPVYLCNMITPKILSYDLRDATQKLYLPKPRTDYPKGSLSYSGASLWNDLPEELRATKSLDLFKRSINEWFSASDSHTANM